MKSFICLAAALVLFLSAIIVRGTEVLFDFETGNLQGWEIVEGRFDRIISDRELFHNIYPEAPDRKYNKQGKYYLSTVEQQPGMPSADSMTGVLESPVFVLNDPKISFLIGGGDYEQTCVSLCVLRETTDLWEIADETALARGTRTEILRRVIDEVPEYVGQKCFLRIIDREPGTWGYIAFDDFHAQGTIDSVATESYRTGRKRAREAERLAELQKIADTNITEHPIVFVRRHYYESKYHAIDTLFNSDEYNVDFNCDHKSLFSPGAALMLIDLATNETTTLLETAEGCIRDPDIHFDAQRIIFSMRKNRDTDYKIWEITLKKSIDSNGRVHVETDQLKQLTFADGVADFDPIYLPDDSIVFASTREPKYNMCSRDISSDLYRMDADGANILQITKNTLFEHNPSLLADGRILYHRWEYVDRNFGDAHAIWTVNPDGTNQSLYWGNNTADPGAIYNPQQIPDSPLMLCIFGPHHDREYGALAIVDRRLGIDGPEPVIRTWPADFRLRVRCDGFDCDSPTVAVSIKYEDPWPLDDSTFLCSRQLDPGGEMGIYLLDLQGNEILLHCESPGCFDAMPLVPRERPPIVPVRRLYDQTPGLVQISNVYVGTHMSEVTPQSAKRLRIVEAPEKRHWSRGLWQGQGYTAPGMNWHSLENKKILGTVPIEDDGSAAFWIPAETFVYFQLLDDRGMMIQSMRSGTVLQPGEVVSCTGCHEDRLVAPQLSDKTMALGREPSRIEPWYGPSRCFSFTAEVQPVFNKHCVECHDYNQPAGETLNLAPDRDFVFNTAYMELWKKGYIHAIGAGPAQLLPAYSWGARKSPLVKELIEPTISEHRELRLSPEDIDRIITWCDLNGVYYPTYQCANPESHSGRTPLTRKQTDRLGELLGRNFPGEFGFNSPGVSVSFERPELSPALKHLDKNSPQYQEAIEILRAGHLRNRSNPEADMPGFIPCLKDQERETKYRFRREAENRFKEAIGQGKKLYDPQTGFPDSKNQ